MFTLEEVEQLITKELEPIKAAIDDVKSKLGEMDKSCNFLSAKFDQLQEQLQSTKGKARNIASEIKTVKQDAEQMKKNINESKNEIDEIAQYLRRDCVEISGLQPTTDQSCDNLVRAIGQEMGLEIEENDISTAHPLLTFDKNRDSKIIVKFTRRDTKNEFYNNRRKVAGRKVSQLSSLSDLHRRQGDKKIYISESLTAQRKSPFGKVNRIKKKLQWKYIWTNNGRIYLKANDNSKTFTFDSMEDLQKFEKSVRTSPITRNIGVLQS